jgi:hypothetical protein
MFNTNKNAKKLKIIDPEESDAITIDPDLMMKVRQVNDEFFVNNITNPIQKRDEGEFAGKAFYLNCRFDWEFGYDSFGLIVLVPLKKKDVDHG